MSTLLLKLAAPMQSWGLASKFDTRDTAREPTKSGVIGLLAAALGINRDNNEELTRLNRLSFGVRIDQPGVLLKDFVIARKMDGDNPFVTTRYYLADAVFLVGLEGEKEILDELIAALHNPVFPLYLGRRSCPPASPLIIGIREKTLYQALLEEPWQASPWFKKRNRESYKTTIIIDAQAGDEGAFIRRDLPVSFSQKHRQYGFRMVKEVVEIKPVESDTLEEKQTEHDAFAGWEGV